MKVKRCGGLTLIKLNDSELNDLQTMVKLTAYHGAFHPLDPEKLAVLFAEHTGQTSDYKGVKANILEIPLGPSLDH
jgi:hypothetical protein